MGKIATTVKGIALGTLLTVLSQGCGGGGGGGNQTPPTPTNNPPTITFLQPTGFLQNSGNLDSIITVSDQDLGDTVNETTYADYGSSTVSQSTGLTYSNIRPGIETFYVLATDNHAATANKQFTANVLRPKYGTHEFIGFYETAQDIPPINSTSAMGLKIDDFANLYYSNANFPSTLKSDVNSYFTDAGLTNIGEAGSSNMDDVILIPDNNTLVFKEFNKSNQIAGVAANSPVYMVMQLTPSEMTALVNIYNGTMQ